MLTSDKLAQQPAPPEYKQSTPWDSGPPMELSQLKYFEYLESLGRLDADGIAALERMRRGRGPLPQVDPLGKH